MNFFRYDHTLKQISELNEAPQSYHLPLSFDGEHTSLSDFEMSDFIDSVVPVGGILFPCHQRNVCIFFPRTHALCLMRAFYPNYCY